MTLIAFCYMWIDLFAFYNTPGEYRTSVAHQLLPLVEAQYCFNLVQTNALVGIQTQDLPDHNLEHNALDCSAMKAG